MSFSNHNNNNDQTPITKILQKAGGHEFVRRFRPRLKDEEIQPKHLAEKDFNTLKQVTSIAGMPLSDIIEAAREETGLDPSNSSAFDSSSNKENHSAPAPAVDTISVLQQIMGRLDTIDKQMEVYHQKIDEQLKDVPDWQVDDECTRLETLLELSVSEGLCANTLVKYYQQGMWYNNCFNAEFKNEDPNTIIKNVIDHCLSNKELLPTGKLNKLFSIGCLLKRQQRFDKLSPRLKQILLKAILTFARTARKRIQNGQEKVNQRMTDDDLLHMVGTTIQMHPRGIPNHKWQLLTKCVLNETVGRRTAEIHWVPIGSFQYEMSEVKTDDGKVETGVWARKITYSMCFMKGKEVGRWRISFWENDGVGVHKNALLIVLIHLERRGAIRSASRVYYGHEPLFIDARFFETEDDLFTKLSTATKMMKEGLLAKLGIGAEGNDDAEFHNSLIAAVKALDEEERKKGTFKHTMWSTHRANDNLQVAERYDHRSNNDLSDFAKTLGYTPSKTHNFGLTCFRAGFRSDRHGNVIEGLDGENYLNQVQSNSASVGLQFYDDHDATREAMGSNMKQRGMKKAVIDYILKSVRVHPTYTNPTFFNQNFPIYTKPLPDTKTFLQQHSVLLTDNINWPKSVQTSNPGKTNTANAAPGPPLHSCHNKNCQYRTMYLGDLVKHMTESHNPGKQSSQAAATTDSSAEVAIEFCCPCGKKFDSFKKYRKHMQCQCTNARGHILREITMSKSDSDKAREQFKTLTAHHCPETECYQRFERKEHLQRHYEDKHGTSEQLVQALSRYPNQRVPPKKAPVVQKRYPCMLCDYSHDQLRGMKEHAVSNHYGEGIYPVPKKGEPFPCMLCEATFAAKNDLDHHCREKHEGGGIYPYITPEAAKSTKSGGKTKSSTGGKAKKTASKKTTTAASKKTAAAAVLENREEVESAPKKKKRGRPKKAPAKDTKTVEDLGTALDALEDEGSAPNTVKGKRKSTNGKRKSVSGKSKKPKKAKSGGPKKHPMENPVDEDYSGDEVAASGVNQRKSTSRSNKTSVSYAESESEDEKEGSKKRAKKAKKQPIDRVMDKYRKNQEKKREERGDESDESDDFSLLSQPEHAEYL